MSGTGGRTEAEPTGPTNAGPTAPTTTAPTPQPTGGSTEDVRGVLPPQIQHYGVDPLTGVKSQFFRHPISAEKEMLAAMTPPGLTTMDSKTLAETTFDAVSLPGKIDISKVETNTDMEVMADAIKTISEAATGVAKGGDSGISRNSGWRSPRQVSLKSIMSEDDLQRNYDTLVEQQATVLDNVRMAQSAVFGKYHWGPAMTDVLTHVNLYARIGQDTLEHYIGLHQHLLMISRNSGWDYAKIALEYHVKKLVGDRVIAMSRLQALVSTYVFLRDSKAQGYNSNKLQEVRNVELNRKLAQVELVCMIANSPKCPKCGGSIRVHPEGRKNCIFSGMSDSQARKKAATIKKAYATVGDDRAEG